MSKVLLNEPIIFIGFPRSGTTIISEIIFNHEDLAWPSNYQDKYPRSVSVNRIRPVLDNSLWQLKGNKPQLNKVSWYNRFTFKPAEAYNFWEYITGGNIDFSKGFLLGEKAEEKRKKIIRSHFERMVKLQKRKRLAFKITGPGRVAYLKSIFPDAIFIEITREPFATIRSLLNVPFWANKSKHLYWQGAYSDSEIVQADAHADSPSLLAAIQYKKIKETIMQEVNTDNANYYSMSYEAFVEAPNKFIHSLIDILNLPASKTIEAYLMNNKIYNRNSKAMNFLTMQPAI